MLEIKVHQDNQKTLLEILREENHYLPAVCAGRGTCGKCRVKIVQGEAAVTKNDRSFFSQEEIEAGWRLACKCIPKGNLCLALEGAEEAGFEMLGAFAGKGNTDADKASGAEVAELPTNNVPYILGVDIGTTTIAMALQNAVSGQLVDEYLTLNRQRIYGADVVSRMQASVEGRGAELQTLVREDLWKGILQITNRTHILPERIVIAANTTMIHLLMGYPCEGLGQYPFTPYHIGEIHGSVGEILGEMSVLSGERQPTDAFAAEEVSDRRLLGVPIHILPGISTFVGADIVADMLVCDMMEASKVSVLIDVGTNGEMAIGNRERILVTSTAAGPAFEGGNISCGTGSVPGAICGVELKPGENCFEINAKTIQGKPPIGICGTGTIEVIYEMLKNQLLDDTGYMEEEELVLAKREAERSISFTQKDVRQLQLAKSAIRAGVETLLLRYGITAQEVDAVYLAGGFGYHINLDKAMGIGLLPKEFQGKIKLLGNGSLQGALQYGRGLWRHGEAHRGTESEESDVMASKNDAAVRKLVALSREIGLAADKDFNELYLEYMNFLG